jgi:hypothetical protein
MKDVESPVIADGEDASHMFQKVEIHIPRVFLRLCSGFYNGIFYIFRVIGGDIELMELRTMLLFWDVLSGLWKYSSAILIRYLAQALKSKTLVDKVNDDVYSEIDFMRRRIESKVNQDGLRPQVLLPILNILEFQQKQLDGLSPWGAHDYVVVFIAEVLWILFFPYLLKKTILPLLRRVLAERRTE